MNTLALYLKQISSVHIRFTQEQEEELCQRMHQGDAKAMQKLVESQLPFVVQIARNIHARYKLKNLTVHDLVAEGNAILVLQIHQFDASRARLTTFTHLCVSQKLKRFVWISRGLLTYPTNAAMMSQAARKRATTGCVDLYTLLHKIGPYTPVDIPMEVDDRQKLVKLIEKFPEREQTILKMRLNDFTLQEIGEKLKITRERVRQIYDRILHTLKVHFGVVAEESYYEYRKKKVRAKHRQKAQKNAKVVWSNAAIYKERRKKNEHSRVS